MEFWVDVEIDRAARPSFGARTGAFIRRQDPETRFWTAFRAAAKRAGESKVAPDLPATFSAQETAVQALPGEVAEIHQQLRTGLPSRIRGLLIERLAPRLDVAPALVYTRVAQPQGAAAAADDVVAALAALRIEIGEVRGGSLELLVIAFGFAKLAALAGITSDEFAGYLKIVTPFALNLLYGTNVPLVGTAKAADGADAPESTEGDTGNPGRKGLVEQASPYVIAAILTGFVLWLIITTFDSESARIADERKVILETVGKQGTALSDERTALAQKLGDLAGKLLDATAQREAALETANRDLSTRQMALITRLDTAAAERDKAVIDFVKARLFPASPSGPPMSGCAPLTGETVRTLQQVLQAQHLYVGSIDGDFGPRSRVALANFQRIAGLSASGLPDRSTMERLGLACDAPAR